MSFADIQQNSTVLVPEQQKQIKGGIDHTSTPDSYIGGGDLDVF